MAGDAWMCTACAHSELEDFAGRALHQAATMSLTERAENNAHAVDDWRMSIEYD